MSDLIWLWAMQMRRIEPYFPLSHGLPRVDDRRIISGIIFVIRNGLRWRDAPAEYGPPKTIYNRFVRWSRDSLGCSADAAVPTNHPTVDNSTPGHHRRHHWREGRLGRFRCYCRLRSLHLAF
jgi:transposase